MKIRVISDLHGRTSWQDADLANYDQIVFLGDYTDSPIFDDSTIYTNLEAIIQLKSRAWDNVTLLIGNHDAHYLHYPHYRCSGFRSSAQPDLSALFDKHRPFFQIAYQSGPYLFNVNNGFFLLIVNWLATNLVPFSLSSRRRRDLRYQETFIVVSEDPSCVGMTKNNHYLRYLVMPGLPVSGWHDYWKKLGRRQRLSPRIMTLPNC